MATLYIAEFADPRSPQGIGGIMNTPIAEQTVAIGGSSTPSAAFQTTTRAIRVHTDAICSIAIGPSPSAATTKMRMAADQTEYFAVTPGEKIAVISNT